MTVLARKELIARDELARKLRKISRQELRRVVERVPREELVASGEMPVDSPLAEVLRERLLKRKRELRKAATDQRPVRSREGVQIGPYGGMNTDVACR